MKTEKITVNELFSGIGAQISALERLGIPCEIKHTSDIDHNAVLAYASIHCGLTEELINTYTEYPTREEMARQLTEINLGYDFQKNKPYNWYRFVNSKSKELEKYWLANKLSRNLGDISKIDKLEYADFWTISFCCQDISNAGKMKGFKLGSNTRSSLLWDNIKLLKQAVDSNNAPKYVMFENVKNLVGHDNGNTFKVIINELEKEHYHVKYAVLNSMYYGNIPQNRERIYIVAFKDKSFFDNFNFPKPIELTKQLSEVIDFESQLDEKYYYRAGKFKSDVYEKLVEAMDDDKSVYQWRRRYVRKNQSGVIPTLTANQGEGGHNVCIIKTKYGIRKMTPRECFNAQGFPNNFILPDRLSDSKLYKQAGNSVCVTVIQRIAEEILNAMKPGGNNNGNK